MFVSEIVITLPGSIFQIFEIWGKYRSEIDFKFSENKLGYFILNFAKLNMWILANKGIINPQTAYEGWTL